jgi:hypothetical protein
MSDAITLHSGVPVDLDTDRGRAFVVDATRAAEGLIADAELQRKYELSPLDFQAIAKDSALIKAILAERERRVISGAAAREAAAKHLVKGPGILDSLMSAADSSAKTKIEAFKELRTTAAAGSGTDRPADTERFIIRIDLSAGGGEVMTFNKSIKIDATDGDGPNGDSLSNPIAPEGNSDVYEYLISPTGNPDDHE